ncbi:MAG TPA: glutamate--tRNA ligase [Deltaproteobacteria bacterium]|nr:glutamate--tRNA ligase [Deltaproteobacteria bacterium]
MTVRTRFAPSPTGYLHIGGARTALFNWLFARHHKGRFILRIEDTDLARSTEESIEAILDGMRWLGLDWDEGPYFQSRRSGLYSEHARRLLDSGAAYRCWCTPDELAHRREKALAGGRPPGYDGRCRDRTDAPDGPFALRFRVPAGSTVVNDAVKGATAFDHAQLEDFVIVRSDGTPTYNLCVVVDDATMDITHVIRGDDHLNNTPKQILLYEALGYKPPVFAHLPMILGADGTRLSKRHGAASVTAYREAGYLPHALVNYLARLGWSHGDEEIFSLDELVEKFSLDAVGRSSSIFNPDKLRWLNQHYIKQTPPGELAALLAPFLKALGVDAGGDDRLERIAATLRERASDLREMAESALFYFGDEVEYAPEAARRFLTADRAEPFRLLIEALSSLDDFSEEAVEGAFREVLDRTGLKLGKLAQPVRVALTGATVSPGIFETIAAMGRTMTLRRLERAVDFMEKAAPK